MKRRLDQASGDCSPQIRRRRVDSGFESSDNSIVTDMVSKIDDHRTLAELNMEIINDWDEDLALREPDITDSEKRDTNLLHFESKPLHELSNDEISDFVSFCGIGVEEEILVPGPKPTLPQATCNHEDGYIQKTDEQTNVRNETVCQIRVSNAPVTCAFFIAALHSARKFRQKQITGGHLRDDGFQAPFMASGNDGDTKYCELLVPEVGPVHGAIVKLRNHQTVTMEYFMLSSDNEAENCGKKEHARLWEHYVVPLDEETLGLIESSDEPFEIKDCLHEKRAVEPFQVVKELRDPDRLKKSKRGNVALAKFSTPVGDAAKLRKVEDILNFLRVSLNNLAASDIDTLASRDWSPAIASLIKGADP